MSDMREIPGYEGRYSASKCGRIFAHPNVSRGQGRWLKAATDRRGYLYVGLCKDGIVKKHKVHRLVALAWLGKPAEEHLQINHIDGVKANNTLENLEWATPSANRKHAFAIGLQVVSEKQRDASRRNITAWNERKAA
jgi:hypothetical protein